MCSSSRQSDTLEPGVFVSTLQSHGAFYSFRLTSTRLCRPSPKRHKHTVLLTKHSMPWKPTFCFIPPPSSPPLQVDDLLHQRQPSAVVMAYGVTNAGKTFTMQGTAERPGLVPQALTHIFKVRWTMARGGGVYMLWHL